MNAAQEIVLYEILSFDFQAPTDFKSTKGLHVKKLQTKLLSSLKKNFFQKFPTNKMNNPSAIQRQQQPNVPPNSVSTKNLNHSVS